MMKQMHENVKLDARVERALEQAPAVRVPHGFAARVTAAAVAQPIPVTVRVRRRFTMSRAMLVTAMVVLAVALFVVAPLAGTKVESWPFALEMVLLAQLAAVGWGVARQGHRG